MKCPNCGYDDRPECFKKHDTDDFSCKLGLCNDNIFYCYDCESHFPIDEDYNHIHIFPWVENREEEEKRTREKRLRGRTPPLDCSDM